MTVLWICLLTALVGLPLKADSTDFQRRPGVTCGVRGGDAHLVWNYDDSADTANVILWYDGTEATGTVMGTYVTGTVTFTPIGSYVGKITFASPMYTAGFKGAKLTFNGLEASDAGNYTTVFQANADTSDTAVLEVAEPDGLGTWEICVDGKCDAISDPLILSASDNVTVQFTKNSALTCDMDIDLTPSSCHMKVGAQVNLTAECDLGNAAPLVDARSLSIDLTFGKNGEVFHTDTIAVSVMPDTPGSPNTWNDLYVIPIVLGVCIIVIIIVVVVVVRRRKKRATGRPHSQDRSSGVSVGASAAGMPPGGQPRPKSQPNPQSGAPSGDMAYKVGYVDPDAPALYHDDRYESGFGNTGYSH